MNSSDRTTVTASEAHDMFRDGMIVNGKYVSSALRTGRLASTITFYHGSQDPTHHAPTDSVEVTWETRETHPKG